MIFVHKSLINLLIMIDILLHKPHLILIQEHMINLLNKKQFAQIMQIQGYRLIMHSKAKTTEGRPTGGLAVWIRSDLYKTYDVKSIQNNEYLQTFVLHPKLDTNTTPSLCITNAYCRPTQRNHERDTFYDKTKHHTDATKIQLIIGDLNAHHPITGSTKTNLNGNKMAQYCTDNNMITLNGELAHGVPTYVDPLHLAESINDIALVPEHQLPYWTEMMASPAESRNKAAHHSIILKSMIPVVTLDKSPEISYTINYNDSDSHRINAFMNNITYPVHKKILETLHQHLDHIQDPEEIQHTLDQAQYVQFAIHHLTALQMCGIRRVIRGRESNPSWEKNEEIQLLLRITTLTPTSKHKNYNSYSINTK